MTPFHKLILYLEKRADEVNPLIPWQVRRYCAPGGNLSAILSTLVGVIIFTVIADRSISSFEDTMQTVASLGRIGVLVIAYLSFTICNFGWCQDDEMMRLTALTRRERCYANLILPLIPPTFLFCALSPLYMVFACCGADFRSLFVSFAIPLLLVIIVFPIWFSFVWFIWKGPRKIKMIESNVWQVSMIYVVFWCIAIGKTLLYVTSHQYFSGRILPDNRYGVVM